MRRVIDIIGELSLNSRVSSRWIVGRFAVLFTLFFATACAPAGSQSAFTPTNEIAVTARSLESIAETAAAKLALPTGAAQSTAILVETISKTPEPDGPEEVDITPQHDFESTGLATLETANSVLEVTATSEGSENVDNSITPQLAPTLTQTVQSTPIDIDFLNGIPIDELVAISPVVRENVKEIYESGQAKGRYPNNFSKLGDSLIATPHFLTQFDKGPYNLGEYAHLQSAIDFFSGSYERYGVAIEAGLHSWGVFDPMWANKDWCQPNESLIACEFRLNNPSILLILLGSNDSGAPESFNYNLRKVVEFTIENGVIPVLATKADRFEGPDNRNNLILRKIAADYQIPLWDFDLVSETIEGRGLQEDQVHLTEFVPNDYTVAKAFQTGHGLHNLTALMVLDRLRQIVTEEID